MPTKNNDGLSGKEYFSLLWKYLKSNKRYENFCDWADTQGGKLYPLKNLSIPEEFQGSKEFEEHPFFVLYNWWGGYKVQNIGEGF